MTRKEKNTFLYTIYGMVLKSTEYVTDENNEMKYSRLLHLDRTAPLLTDGNIHNGWDFENGKENQLITGITENGIAYWGKKAK